nr:MAG TPA: hypothetical protein [Caudoviricetes sp.]
MKSVLPMRKQQKTIGENYINFYPGIVQNGAT